VACCGAPGHRGDRRPAVPACPPPVFDGSQSAELASEVVGRQVAVAVAIEQREPGREPRERDLHRSEVEPAVAVLVGLPQPLEQALAQLRGVAQLPELGRRHLRVAVGIDELEMLAEARAAGACRLACLLGPGGDLHPAQLPVAVGVDGINCRSTQGPSFAGTAAICRGEGGRLLGFAATRSFEFEIRGTVNCRDQGDVCPLTSVELPDRQSCALAFDQYHRCCCVPRRIW